QRKKGAEATEQRTYVVSLVDVEIGLHVPLVGAVYGTGHAGPWLLDREDTLDVIAVDLLSRHGVDNGGLNTEARQRSTSGLRRGDARHRSNYVRARFRLPVCLAPRTLATMQITGRPPSQTRQTYVDDLTPLLPNNF